MDIKSIIKEKGMTLEQVASLMPSLKGEKKIGISQPSLSSLINGNPSVAALRNIASIIGCEITDFFRDEVRSTQFVGFVHMDGENTSFSTIAALHEFLYRVSPDIYNQWAVSDHGDEFAGAIGRDEANEFMRNESIKEWKRRNQE